MYGAEMWILALARHFDSDKINCQLAITRETLDQNIEIVDRYTKLGLTCHQIKMNGRFDPRAILRLSRLIGKEKIDIVHTHGYKSDILGLIAARIRGVKTVSTPHGFENAHDLKLKAFIWLGCIFLRFFDIVAPLSEDLRSAILGVKVKPKKIRLIVNGVDLTEVEEERNAESEPLFSNPDEKTIGYVGQIAHRKNVRDMIRAFDLFYKKHKNARLVLIGDGPLRDELEAYACTLASADRIEFLGYRKDRMRIVKELDVFCMTSTLEGIPRCMMEAMGMGAPVAAFEIPGVDKLIVHEKTGLMAEFGNVAELTKCWERILFDEEFSKTIARNGRQHVFENFSAKRMAREYSTLYNEMTGRGA